MVSSASKVQQAYCTESNKLKICGARRRFSFDFYMQLLACTARRFYMQRSTFTVQAITPLWLHSMQTGGRREPWHSIVQTGGRRSTLHNTNWLSPEWKKEIGRCVNLSALPCANLVYINNSNTGSHLY